MMHHRHESLQYMSASLEIQKHVGFVRVRLVGPWARPARVLREDKPPKNSLTESLTTSFFLGAVRKKLARCDDVWIESHKSFDARVESRPNSPMIAHETTHSRGLADRQDVFLIARYLLQGEYLDISATNPPRRSAQIDVVGECRSWRIWGFREIDVRRVDHIFLRGSEKGQVPHALARSRNSALALNSFSSQEEGLVRQHGNPWLENSWNDLRKCFVTTTIS